MDNSSVADTKDIEITETSFLSTNDYRLICKKCGCLVDRRYYTQHKDMHKFMTEVVAALENHKSKVLQLESTIKTLRKMI